MSSTLQMRSTISCAHLSISYFILTDQTPFKNQRPKICETRFTNDIDHEPCYKISNHTWGHMLVKQRPTAAQIFNENQVSASV